MSAKRDLREILREGDPYDGAAMSAADATRIKARIRAAADEKPAATSAWQLAAVATAGVALLAAGLWLVSPVSSPDTDVLEPALDPVGPGAGATSEPAAPPAEIIVPEPGALMPESSDTRVAALRAAALSPPAIAAADPAPETRRVRMTAPRGTRIIWTLDPAFDTPDSTLNGDDDRLQGADAR